jgi:hypothetical protein
MAFPELTQEQDKYGNLTWDDVYGNKKEEEDEEGLTPEEKAERASAIASGVIGAAGTIYDWARPDQHIKNLQRDVEFGPTSKSNQVAGMRREDMAQRGTGFEAGLEGASAGAEIGSAFGPWGTLIGAGAGAIGGAVSHGVKKKKAESEFDKLKKAEAASNVAAEGHIGMETSSAARGKRYGGGGSFYGSNAYNVGYSQYL